MSMNGFENVGKNSTYETRNRMTEQFLYAHGIKEDGHFKDDEFMTCWWYNRTPELEQALDELENVRSRPRDFTSRLSSVGSPVDVRNWKLEKFLFLHGIRADYRYTDDDAMTVWRFRNTSEFQRLRKEFQQIQETAFKAA